MTTLVPIPVWLCVLVIAVMLGLTVLSIGLYRALMRSQAARTRRLRNGG